MTWLLSETRTTRKQGQSSLKNACKHYQPLPHGAGFIQDFSSSPTTTITTITPTNPVDTSRTKRERCHLITVHREASILSSYTSLSSLCMILMGSKCPPSSLVSQELVTVSLLRTKGKGKSRMAEVRKTRLLVGEQPASPQFTKAKHRKLLWVDQMLADRGI